MKGVVAGESDSVPSVQDLCLGKKKFYAADAKYVRQLDEYIVKKREQEEKEHQERLRKEQQRFNEQLDLIGEAILHACTEEKLFEDAADFCPEIKVEFSKEMMNKVETFLFKKRWVVKEGEKLKDTWVYTLVRRYYMLPFSDASQSSRNLD